MDFYLFGNNPKNPQWTGGRRSRGYDVLDPAVDHSRFSVYHHRQRIKDGDSAAVFQFDGGMGSIVALARITGSARRSGGWDYVPWEVRQLPPGRRIAGGDLAKDPAFYRRKPFVPGNMIFANPILLDEERWEAIATRLAPDDRRWVERR